MKVSITIDFDDEQRRALASNTGGVCMASRREIQAFMKLAISATLDDKVSDYEKEFGDVGEY